MKKIMSFGIISIFLIWFIFSFFKTEPVLENVVSTANSKIDENIQLTAGNIDPITTSSYFTTPPPLLVSESCFIYVDVAGWVRITGYRGRNPNVPDAPQAPTVIPSPDPSCNTEHLVIPATLDGKNVRIIGKDSFRKRYFSTIYIYSAEVIEETAFMGEPYYIQGPQTYAFYLPDNVTTIWMSAFSHSDIIGILDLPDSLISLGLAAFYWNKIEGVIFNTNLTTIPVNAFWANKIKSIVFPNNITTLSEASFAGNEIETITFNNNITVIPPRAFYANNLSSITFPATLTQLGEQAFMQNPLFDVTIPQSITTIGTFVFGVNNDTPDVPVVIRVHSSDSGLITATKVDGAYTRITY